MSIILHVIPKERQTTRATASCEPDFSSVFFHILMPHPIQMLGGCIWKPKGSSTPPDLPRKTGCRQGLSPVQGPPAHAPARTFDRTDGRSHEHNHDTAAGLWLGIPMMLTCKKPHSRTAHDFGVCFCADLMSVLAHNIVKN